MEHAISNPLVDTFAAGLNRESNWDLGDFSTANKDLPSLFSLRSNVGVCIGYGMLQETVLITFWWAQRSGYSVCALFSCTRLHMRVSNRDGIDFICCLCPTLDIYISVTENWSLAAREQRLLNILRRKGQKMRGYDLRVLYTYCWNGRVYLSVKNLLSYSWVARSLHCSGCRWALERFSGLLCEVAWCVWSFMASRSTRLWIRLDRLEHRHLLESLIVRVLDYRFRGRCEQLQSPW